MSIFDQKINKHFENLIIIKMTKLNYSSQCFMPVFDKELKKTFYYYEICNSVIML